MHDLQVKIETHDKSLDQLTKEVEAAQAHKAKLIRAQKLFHAMVSLHQSENVLALVDKRVAEVKQDVKKIGEAAEDIVRERNELKSQLEESIGSDSDKLLDIKRQLQHQSDMLSALSAKRKEVAEIVGEWRDHVDGLRALHGLPSHSGNGNEALLIPKLPHPPESGDQAEQESEEEAEKEEAAEEAAAAADGSGSGSGPAPVKKTPFEKIGPKVEAEEVEAEDVTAKPKQIKATHDAITDLVNVHLPAWTGSASRPAPAAAAAAKPASFLSLEESANSLPRVRRNRAV